MCTTVQLVPSSADLELEEREEEIVQPKKSSDDTIASWLKRNIIQR